jgi:hypothetical protein
MRSNFYGFSESQLWGKKRSKTTGSQVSRKMCQAAIRSMALAALTT